MAEASSRSIVDSTTGWTQTGGVSSPAVEPLDAEIRDMIEVDPEPEVDVAPRQAPLWAIVAFLAGGGAALVVAIGVLTDVTAEVRILLSVVGLVALFYGYRGIGRRIAGPGFQAGLWLAVVWLALVAFCAIFADFLPLAEARRPSQSFDAPVMATPDLFSRHPLGTDRQGLDILGGIMYGFRVSAVVGVGTVAIGIVVGGLIGVVAGYYRRGLDRAVELLTNSMLAFPPLILLLALAAALERNVQNITFALAIVSIPVYIRLARATTLVICEREYVLAAKAIGARNRHIIRKDIIPVVVRPLLAYAFVVIAVIIVAEASLSFLGLGIPRPEPTLGNMISAGQSDFDRRPHLVFAPAVALFLVVLCLNQVGEKVQQRWNPRQAKI